MPFSGGRSELDSGNPAMALSVAAAKVESVSLRLAVVAMADGDVSEKAAAVREFFTCISWERKAAACASHAGLAI